MKVKCVWLLGHARKYEYFMLNYTQIVLPRDWQYKVIWVFLTVWRLVLNLAGIKSVCYLSIFGNRNSYVCE